MAQMSLPAAPSYNRTSYSGLLGCDFSVDPSLVDRKRSPDCLNMISDEGGNPIKRKGWEIANDSGTGKVENIWSFYGGGKRYIIFTRENGSKSDLKCIGEDGTEYQIGSGNVKVEKGKLCGFYTGATESQYGFYILDGEKFHKITYNNGLQYSEVTPFVPTILISREPTGGGVVYQGINLLTRERKEEFLNTDNNKTFMVSAEVDTTKPYSLYYRNTSGDWSQDTSATVSGNRFTVTTQHSPLVAGQDNIRIQYFATGASTSSRVLQCIASANFSSTYQDQIFLSGNPSYPNTVFYSEAGDVTYFPDLNYIRITGKNKIMGFLNLGEYLAVVKDGAYDDSTIYLVYNTTIEDEEVSSIDGSEKVKVERAVAIKRSIAGIGAISKNAFAVLNDEPLFLSEYGVYGITSMNTNSEKIVKNRSFLVDQKLTKEELDKAVAVVWNNYYVVAVDGDKTKEDYVRDKAGNIVLRTVTKTMVNPVTGETITYEAEEPIPFTAPAGKMYLLDGRHKTNDYSGNTSYGYESYYWEGIPAISMTSYDKELWFGTADGKVCRFKNSGEQTDYADGTVMDGVTAEGINPSDDYDGIPIVARWSTPNDNDGRTEYFKKMMKKGTMCTVAPYTRSSVKVYLSVDGFQRKLIGTYNVDVSQLFDGEIEFERLSFDASTAPKDRFFKKKQKKYKRLQIIIENDAPNEPFGVFEIVKSYIYQRYAK